MGINSQIKNPLQRTEIAAVKLNTSDALVFNQSILDSVTNAIILIDQSAVIAFVNQQTKELFGYKRDDKKKLKWT